MIRIFSWNVNGIRSVARKGLFGWLSREAPDILCLQEVKALPEELDEMHRYPFGFKSHWFPAKRKGYSGVATYLNAEAISVSRGMGVDEYDSEGRVLTLEFPEFFLVNAYFPNTQRDHARLSYKLSFCKTMLDFCDRLQKKKNILLSGDFNIAHKEIDLRNPKENVNNAGFLPEERAWLDLFVERGYVDVFREFCKAPDCYTWWSYRPGVRERNIGWRLDYHFVNRGFLSKIKGSRIHPEVKGSDHCPVEVLIDTVL